MWYPKVQVPIIGFLGYDHSILQALTLSFSTSQTKPNLSYQEFSYLCFVLCISFHDVLDNRPVDFSSHLPAKNYAAFRRSGIRPWQQTSTYSISFPQAVSPSSKKLGVNGESSLSTSTKISIDLQRNFEWLRDAVYSFLVVYVAISHSAMSSHPIHNHEDPQLLHDMHQLRVHYYSSQHYQRLRCRMLFSRKKTLGTATNLNVARK